MAKLGKEKGRQRKAAGLGRAEALELEIAGVKGLPIATLRTRWKERFGDAPPTIRSGDILGRMYAWRLQEEAFGGLAVRTEDKLENIVDALDTGSTVGVSVRREISAGVVLTRAWRGVIHTVVVTDDGVEHEGTVYGSLSDVARAITGTRWSGPRFFGLEQKPARRSGTGQDASSRSRTKEANRSRRPGPAEVPA